MGDEKEYDSLTEAAFWPMNLNKEFQSFVLNFIAVRYRRVDSLAGMCFPKHSHVLQMSKMGAHSQSYRAVILGCECVNKLLPLVGFYVKAVILFHAHQDFSVF
jgi:hypothetical protein